MRLFRWLFTLVTLAAVIWFGTMVPLGKHSLFGHLRAIAATSEAHDLADGTRQQAAKVVDEVKREMKSPPAPGDHGGGGGGGERISDGDRRSLDHLVDEKSARARAR